MNRTLKLCLMVTLLASLGTATLLYAQQVWNSGNILASSTDCSTANSCVIATIPINTGSSSFTVSGTFSATLQFEVSADNINYVAVSAFPPSSTTGVTSTTAGGTWTVSLAGMGSFRVRGSSYTSGTAVVRMAISNALSAFSLGGGGGGSGGTITPSTAGQVGVFTGATTIAGGSTFAQDANGTVHAVGNGGGAGADIDLNGTKCISAANSSNSTFCYNSGIGSWDAMAAGSLVARLSTNNFFYGALVNDNNFVRALAYTSTTNCSSAAAPAVCGSAAAGSVAIPTGTNPTLTINNSSITAVSEIFLQNDESITIAATTCNTTLSTLVQPVVTARVVGVSFTIQIGAIIATNKACVSYHIYN